MSVLPFCWVDRLSPYVFVLHHTCTILYNKSNFSLLWYYVRFCTLLDLFVVWFTLFGLRYPVYNTKVNIFHGSYTFKYLCLLSYLQWTPEVLILPYSLITNYLFHKDKSYYFSKIFTYHQLVVVLTWITVNYVWLFINFTI